ncbi:hypothetical protein HANVADRAFT_47825 [Hanseniaspora valbyensis NRRL Y-1626]|uniref:Protein kinase domain-containing protein n=1 Tax=Hanseniaspora valbyensis NRRL Y-1626 TaxID=766949 RepID=A0A1B7TGJ0_9ASCO|nr:hypothetical protein HANVADRAFT_47825 [Hanseniaspora valbyensis NRRL Y-1626]
MNNTNTVTATNSIINTNNNTNVASSGTTTTRKQQQRWSMISTSTSNIGNNNNSFNNNNNNINNSNSFRLNNHNANNNNSLKRYSMSSLTHNSLSSLSLDTATLTSDENISTSHRGHKKTASIEESLVNINIERFSANSNSGNSNNINSNNNTNTSSGGSGMTMSSSDFMFTSITEDTTPLKGSKSLSLDKTKKRYSGYLNDYVCDQNFNFGTNNNNNNNYYKNTEMGHSRSISSLSSIIASANSYTNNTNNNNINSSYSRRIPNTNSTMSLKRGTGIPNSHSNASLSSNISTTSESSKSSKWRFWRRKSMMNLSEYTNPNETNNPNNYRVKTTTNTISGGSTITHTLQTGSSNGDMNDNHSLKAKSSIDSIKSKIKMKLFQEPQSIDIEKPVISNGISDSPKSNISGSSMGRVPKRSSFISLKRPSKPSLRNKTSQQSLLRNKTSRDSLATMNGSNGNTNNNIISKGSGTPTDDIVNNNINSSFESNSANYSKHYTFDSQVTGYKQQQQQMFNNYSNNNNEAEDDFDENTGYSTMDSFIKLCYKVDDISRIFQRINSKDIYYQRDTTVVTKCVNNNVNSSIYGINSGTSTICKYLAFDTLDTHKIDLILKEIEITKKMTSLLRDKLIEQTGDQNVTLKQISDAYGISPILNMSLISNIFPEDYSKKHFHIMINKLYDMRQNETYSCILKIEYFDLGVPLSIFLYKSPRPSSRVISKIFIKILHLLSKLEKIGFQHQDLNLDNIIVNSAYNVHIIDYKVCKFQQEVNTRLDHPIFYKRDSPHYEVYLEMRKVIPYIEKTGDNFGWCHIIWIKYILSKMLESINNNRDKHYDTLMNWLKFILKHQADLENCRDLISYQKKKK